jgi:intein-encoded DNA endonuclease-like protein
MLRKKNEDFFKTWTSSMAYVLGFFAADGAMTKGKRGNCYIEFTSADKDLLFEIRKALGSNHKIGGGGRNGTVSYYRLQIGSRVMFDDLVSLGFTRRKSLRMNMPSVPKELLGDFVRGYFDGDGNVWAGLNHTNRSHSEITLMTVFTSGSRGFLSSLRKRLFREIGILGSLKSDDKTFRLQYSILPSLFLYEFMYNNATLYLARKKVIFEEFKKLRA